MDAELEDIENDSDIDEGEEEEEEGKEGEEEGEGEDEEMGEEVTDVALDESMLEDSDLAEYVGSSRVIFLRGLRKLCACRCCVRHDCVRDCT